MSVVSSKIAILDLQLEGTYKDANRFVTLNIQEREDGNKKMIIYEHAGQVKKIKIKMDNTLAVDSQYGISGI